MALHLGETGCNAISDGIEQHHLHLIQSINFIANRYNGHCIRSKKADLTEGEWKNAKGWLIPTTYFRIECIDEQGRIAWSNPIYRP